MARPETLSAWLANIFAALGHPIRVRIIMLLDDDDRSVADLTETLGVSQQVVSFHIKCLKKAGLVVPVDREGRYPGYELDRAQFRSALDLVVALAHERPPLPLGNFRLLAKDRPGRPIR
jgi:ArsR family transcriptional regulator, zinc-responsive transcriptional repressor